MIERESAPARRGLSTGRVVLLVISAVCLYLFGPSIGEVFAAWDRLGEFHPAWIPIVLACETASFACVWNLQRIGLATDRWFDVVTTQLASNAFNRVTPGGGATGTALQARLLVDAGFSGASTASTLTVQSILMSAVVVAMPLLSVPWIIVAGTAVPSGLVEAAWIGAGVFMLMLGFGTILLGTRRPVYLLGDVIERAANRVRRGRPPIEGLGARLLEERDAVRVTMGAHWWGALTSTIGRWGFEYLALLVVLVAIGASPDPALVLFAFVAASTLGLLPFTPGGLGFVEAGLTATLSLAGITPEAAVLATLMFRLVSFWLPLPIGGVAWWLFRRRYGGGPR